MEKDLNEIILDAKLKERNRKFDVQLEELNAAIDDLTRDFYQDEVERQIKESKARGEDYFTVEE